MSRTEKVIIQEHGSGKIAIVPKYQLEKSYEELSTLSPGYYNITEEKILFFTMQAFCKADVPAIPTSAIDIVKYYIDLSEIERYFSSSSYDIHRQLGIKCKLGMLFSGKQGTGKTTNAYALAAYMVKNHDARVVVVESSQEYNMAVNTLSAIKREFGDFLSVIIFDEAEEALRDNENYFKKILDSVESLDRNISLFCTNYPDRIPDTIKNRPSRIKHHCDFSKGIDEEIVYMLMTHINNTLDPKVKLSEKELKKIVPILSGATFDEMKTLFMDTALAVNLSKLNESKYVTPTGIPSIIKKINSLTSKDHD